MKTKFLQIMLLISAISIACDDDEKPKTLPVITTAVVKDVTTTTATGGGEITDDGNSEITASGLVYSSVNATPTIADSKTEEKVTEGVFTSSLENLFSSTTYHVRAYATNAVGTGYGEVVDFTTGNAAPLASGVSIAGEAQVSALLTASYAYSDAEDDAESGTTIQWYRANDGAGSGEIAIAGAVANTYTPIGEDEFKYIRVGVIPKASAGTSPGVQVKSSFVGPVEPEPTTVTFTYNGASVTYNIIISSVTGRRWLDRNLGAPSAPTSSSDFANYGDAFQWGRLADGHQLVNRGATNAETTGVNGTTAISSSTDVPDHSLFILPPSTPTDWRDPQNDNLWQGVNGPNNPCPAGWRLPTEEEWLAENITDLNVGYTQLKLTTGGYRRTTSGTFSSTSTSGFYWSSTLASDYPGTSRQFVITSTTGVVNSADRAQGILCRCIKD